MKTILHNLSTIKYIDFIIGVPLLAFCITYFWEYPFNRCYIDSFIINLLITTLFTLIIWVGNYAVITFFRKKYPDVHNTFTRISLQLFSGILSTLAVSISLSYYIAHALNSVTPNPAVLKANLIISIGFTIFISTIYETVYFFRLWKQSIIQVQQYKRASLQSKYESLKNQVNPHFLFNSLNTLTTIIEEDQQQAVEFVQHLSQVYRYGLSNSNKELVSLEEELKFIQSYFYMLEKRFGKNLIISKNIDSKYLYYQMPPLSIQLLVENVIKHNIISSAHPLEIIIETKPENYITIKNNLQKKLSVESSTGIGLQNISKRYEYFTNASLIIKNDSRVFEVSLPLINRNESINN